MISTRVHNKGKFINEFMFCATELSEPFTDNKIMHQSIPAAPIPPRANPRALALFLFWVANSRGWG